MNVGDTSPYSAYVSWLDRQSLASFYITAKERVIEAGFAEEIDWQEGVTLASWDEQTFLRESGWVVLSTGFREAIVRRRFEDVSRAFFHWAGADLIVSHEEKCRKEALTAFGNVRKIDAVLAIAKLVAREGIESIREQIGNRGTDFIQEFPFMGPVTACHLAKNLGLAVVKPDRHLVRIAERSGCGSPTELCQVIAEVVGDSLSVIDIVLWRYATIENGASVETRRLPGKADVDRRGSVIPGAQD